jgi:hypothetical protein
MMPVNIGRALVNPATQWWIERKIQSESMLFGNKGEQYPHLVAYLRETERLDLFKEFHQRWGRIIASAFFGPIIFGVLFRSFITMFGLILISAILGLTALFVMRKKKAELFTPEIESRLEAHRLFGALRKMLTLNRLHRDMSESTLTLLNEIARTRLETKQLLESPYWRQPTLPDTYCQLRDQAVTATDQAMMDAVLQFRATIPTEVSSRKPGDYVNEALETFLKVPKSYSPGGDIGFEAAFKIADKLQQMRNELEHMTVKGESETMFTPSDLPGGMLDLTMSEIRTIRQAEEELRQGL